MSRTFGVKKELLFDTCHFLKLLKTVTEEEEEETAGWDGGWCFQLRRRRHR